MKTRVILFEKEFQNKIFQVMGKTIDSEGFIVEKGNTTQRVQTKRGEEIKAGEFAGVKTGSEEFIKNDINSILELADSIE